MLLKTKPGSKLRGTWSAFCSAFGSLNCVCGRPAGWSRKSNPAKCDVELCG